ncbi:MAG: phage tail tube protein, partial [Candidatus Thorarchaeota archaeon]
MTLVPKIDSNVTGLAYQEETSLGVANPANPWKELEPNSYSDFGPSVTNVARAPIVNDRQRKKGVLTDLDASGGFSGDLTQEVLPDIAQGVFYADLEAKDEANATDVTVTSSYTVTTPEGTPYLVDDLIWVSGMDDAENNGLKTVASSTATTIVVVETLVDAAAQTGTIRRVGHEWAAGDLDVTAPAGYPTIDSTLKDLTELGLIPGEWIFVGGDDPTATTGDQFAGAGAAVNNGWKRVRSIAAGSMVIDKSDATMIAETGAEPVRIFFGARRLRNRGIAADIVRRSYQIERQLGYSDTDHDVPAGFQQAEYMEGAVASTLQVNIATADKMTFDIGFMGTTFSQVSSHASADQRKVGSSRLQLVESEAYNSSSDVSRINMSQHSLTDEAPTQLFAYIQDLNFTIDNTLTANKAVGVLGAFDITAGIFAVSGSLNAFYADTATTTLIQTNADVSIDFHVSKANQGMSIDFPLVTLGDGRPNVEADAAIMVPITFEAASGAKIDPALDHTILI